MRSPRSGSPIGWLEVLGFLIGSGVVVCALIGGWQVDLLIALIMLAVVYAALRDVRALSRLRRETRTHASEWRRPPEGSPRTARSTSSVRGQRGVETRRQATHDRGEVPLREIDGWFAGRLSHRHGDSLQPPNRTLSQPDEERPPCL